MSQKTFEFTLCTYPPTKTSFLGVNFIPKLDSPSSVNNFPAIFVTVEI